MPETVIPETQVSLDWLDLDLDGARVVAIGGGHGLAQVLEAVQGYAGDITAIVTVADDGGSSGRLTTAMDIPPPGDIRRALLALSAEPSIWSELFGYRFTQGDVAGHSLGNLMLAALTDLLEGDFEAAIRVSASLMGARGRVVPAAAQSLHLQAVIDGVVVDGQAAITRTRGTVEELRLIPGDEKAHPAAIEAIAAADQIVIGPGSLYTSVISALMVPGLAEAVMAAPAPVIYVLNAVTQDGETWGMSGRDHVAALAGFGGVRGPGSILVARPGFPVPPGVEPVSLTAEEAAEFGWEVVEADLLDDAARWPQHDPIKLGQALRRLL